MKNTVYKIVEADAWRRACQTGAYMGSADDARDGFIHLSFGDQIAGTVERHFKHRTGLLLVAFDAASLGPALKLEPSRNGALFPHYYGDLPTALALWEKDMITDADGIARIAGELG